MSGLLDLYGETVRTAIVSAMRAVNYTHVDISAYLEIIQNGRYGADIRMAIHDALYALAEAVPEEQGASIIGTAQILSGGE